ncbi:MAG: cell envelope integrity protein TolA [Rhodoferax sp.]|nr:cell envelope integrity protein TolA [Rhodoferax sp.]
MRTATDRLEFAPPPTPGLMRSLGLAVLAHALLLAALTLGVQWKRDDVTLTAEAEVWSAVPQQTAPKLEAPPEEPVPPPAPEPEPAPPRPVPPPIPQVQPPAPPEVDIALEQEKARLKKLKEQKQAKEKLALEQRREEKLRQDKLKQEQLKLDKLKQEKLLADQKREQDKRVQDKRELEKRELDKREKDKAVAQEKKKAEQEAQRKEDAAKAQAEAKQMEAQRQANLQRMAGLAGATGTPGATGTALQSSGPSASYAGRIRASIKPNIVFTDDITGNPVAEVEVRTSPDGTIISRKLIKPSGVDSWDDAVLKAIDRTGKLPKDVDGRVPQSLVISFRPKN